MSTFSGTIEYGRYYSSTDGYYTYINEDPSISDLLPEALESMDIPYNGMYIFFISYTLFHSLSFQFQSH